MKRILRLTKLKVVLLVALALILVARAVLPGILLNKLNDYLAEFSPTYSIHIGEMHLGLLTFSYRFENLEAFYKKDHSKFFDVKNIRVQLSFRELLHLRILTNVRVDEGKFVLTKALFEGSKKADPKDDAKKAKDKLFPVRIAVVEVHQSSFDFADFIAQDPSTRWRVSEIEARVLNLTPLEANPYTSFFLQGHFLGNAPFKVAGRAKTLQKPVGWKLDAEMKDFDLVAANPMLMRELPFDFSAGQLDLYSEVKSEKGQMSGYVKPFLKRVKILTRKTEFKSVKHFFFDVAGAFANFMLKNADTKTTALKIDFHEEDGHLKVETGDAIKSAIKNGYKKPLTPGTDDSVPFM